MSASHRNTTSFQHCYQVVAFSEPSNPGLLSGDEKAGSHTLVLFQSLRRIKENRNVR